jgi:Flp pilus assembly protein TadG
MMQKRSKNRGILRHRSANTMIEMVLMMPIFLGLAFGAVEYGYAMYIKHMLQGASREGARAAIVAGASVTDVQKAVDDAMAAGGFASNKYRPTTITPANWSTSGLGTTVTVTTSAQWGTIGISALPDTLLGIQVAIPKTKIISASTVMRKEG